jgi:hypothetical protein
MRNFALTLLAGASVLVASNAFAADVFVQTGDDGLANPAAITQARLVCDEGGRCYRTRASRRVVIRQDYGDSYDYAPRERYIERPGYYDESPRVGIGLGGPGGVGIGFGGDRNRW